MPDDAQFPLTVGGIRIVGLNAPEVLGDFGSEQKAAIFEFASGTTTAQLLGRFPKMIVVTQVIRGANAIALSNQIDQLTSAGEVALTWAGWTWTGLVLNVELEPMNDGEIRYRIHFRPLAPQNQNAGNSTDPFTGLASGTGSQSPQTLLSGGVSLAVQQVANPTSQFTFSPTIANGVSSLRSATAQALASNSNNLANVPAATIAQLQNQVGALQNLLAPLIKGTDSQAASAAIDLNNTLTQVNNALGLPVSLVKEVQVQDPDLFVLATQYYSDASLAKLIADANDLNDFQLSGRWSLLIPGNPGATVIQPPTLI